MNKLTEGDLVIPVLAFLKDNGGSATIAQIVSHIRATYPLSPLDLRPSATRPGELIFEQQIRNLRSHDKLAKLGLAENISGGFRLLPGVADMLDGGNAEWVFDIVASQPAGKVRQLVDSIDKKKRVVSLDENAFEGVAMTAARQHAANARLVCVRLLSSISPKTESSPVTVAA